MENSVGKALGAACPGLRAAGSDDMLAGLQPGWVAYPESAEEASALLRAAAEHDLAVTPVGDGTKLDWGGGPDRCDLLIDTSCLTLDGEAVIDHSAGDLVARAAAGLPISTLQGALGENGQELALDNPMDDGTVGGMLATGLAGPRRFRYGEPRDLLIGITVVLADGTIARSGGKVVKNVAGYDLGKLFTGSHGTLGLIVDATFRLHPLPAERIFVTCVFPDSQSAADAARAVAGSQAVPSAIEIDSTASGAPVSVGVLLEGTATRDRADAVRRLLAQAVPQAAAGPPTSGPSGQDPLTADEPPLWWGTLPEGESLLEIRPELMGLAATLDACTGPVRGSVTALYTTGGAAVHDRVWEVRGPMAAQAPQAATLMARIKSRFDPSNRMSPGRLV